MKTETAIREHLLNLLGGRGAHVPFDKAVADFPEDLRGRKVKNLPYTAWQLLEHMRIAQWDILEFSRDATHVSPKFPDGYWPETKIPPARNSWSAAVKSFRQDLKAMEQLVENPSTDLLACIPHGDGQTIFREVLVLADHTAYHLGELVMLRRLLGAWK